MIYYVLLIKIITYFGFGIFFFLISYFYIFIKFILIFFIKYLIIKFINLSIFSIYLLILNSCFIFLFKKWLGPVGIFYTSVSSLFIFIIFNFCSLLFNISFNSYVFIDLGR